jgi:hypothetical protein
VSTGIIRLAVLSDLHAAVPIPGTSKASHLLATAGAKSNAEDPVEGLLQLIGSEELEADVLLSPGDLGDKGNPAGIAFAWDKFHLILSRLKTSKYAAATGNHDLDSRAQFNLWDPTEALKKLAPAYPQADTLECMRYWTHYFSVLEVDQCRLVLLNSAAFHWKGEVEWERGRVSIATLEWLEAELRSRPKKQINVLICHHHPHRHPELRFSNSSYDVMVDGNHLIELLSRGEFGEWLIIHGHKHHPYLSYAAGPNGSPTVLSCGSFSGLLYPELGTNVRNQFYVVEIPILDSQLHGLVGRVRAWDWTYGRGWCKAQRTGSGLRHESSFGCRENSKAVATALGTIMAANKLLPWSTVTSTRPTFQYLLPQTLEQAAAELESRFGIRLIFDDDKPAQLVRIDP